MHHAYNSRRSMLKLLFILLFGSAFMTFAGARMAAAQDSPGNITLFADPAATSCSIADQAEGPFTIYVMHVNVWGMLSSDFRVIESTGFLATYVSETTAVLGHVGNFRGGISLGYGLCQYSSLLLGTISYQGHGTSQPCSYLDVVAWRFPWPATQDCNFWDWPAPPPGKFYVNPQPGQCQPSCTVVATEQTTWGGVKALYRN